MRLRRHVGIALWIALVLTLSSPAHAQRAVILVRHADTFNDPSNADRPLSPAGEQRAQRLATVLRDVGITAIYISELQRTQKTAEPLARALHIMPVSVPSGDREGLIRRIRDRNRQDVVLIVGHSSSIPGLLKLLGDPDTVTIRDDEFDRLFIVTPNGNGSPTVLHLHY